MNKIIRFFTDYCKAVQVSKMTKGYTISLINKLLEYDPLEKIKFEVSFKVRDDMIPT